ncbi:MAG: SDR family NAD(P)-dependent oxidoreductase [Alphaproteobacteria bacterium]|nr:SDR family NAD(P)-dependent oxidoreductase [Alphaproteobacteria bacterium]
MLKGKVALVTGASRGIGAAIAHALAKNKARLILTARDESKLNKIAKDLHETYETECLVIPCDVTSSKDVQALYKTVKDHFGCLDILAANAGVLSDGLLGMVSDTEIDAILNVNIKGVLNHLQPAARLMRKNKSGSIIITSSIIGRTGNKGQTVYAASKAATLGIMMSAAKELGPDGIRVNAIAPGFIETDMTAHLSSQIREQRLNGIALSRTGTPEDVADVVLFLASDLSRYVSGQVIGVDGCMVI